MEHEQEDISFKETVHEISAYVKYLWSKKIIISIISIVFGGLLYLKAIQSKTTYTSEISFMLESPKTGGMSRAMSVFQSFGLGGSNNYLSSEKIQELLKSKRIIINTLLLPYPPSENKTQKSKEIYCNYWLKNNTSPKSKNSLIQIRSNIKNYEDLNLEEVRLIMPLYKKITLKMLSSNVSLKSDIFDIKFTSNEEEFSFYFIKDLLKTLEEFYLTKTTETEQATYNLINSNIDSVKTELLKKEAHLAEITDQSNNVVKSKGHIEIMTLSREIQILNLMYAETIKSKEMAKFSLLQKKPILQVIDYPQMPIRPEKDSKIKGGIAGLFLGSVMSIIFFLIQRFYREKLR